MLINEIYSEKYVDKSNDMFSDILCSFDDALYGNKNSYLVEGNIGNFEIRSTTFRANWYYYMLFDKNKNKYAFGVELTKFGRNPRCLQIDKIGGQDGYRGMDLSVKLYSWLILQKQIILISGFSQSAGGRSIWERLAKTSNIFMFGYDITSKESFQIDTDDLFNEDIYAEDINDDINYLKLSIDELNNQQMKLDQNYNKIKIKSIDTEIKRLSNQIYKLKKQEDHSANFLRLVAIKNTKK
jgi:hypothetical protein